MDTGCACSLVVSYETIWDNLLPCDFISVEATKLIASVVIDTDCIGS
jgi:hypothetical protein